MKRGIFILHAEAFETIYGDEHRQAIAGLVELPDGSAVSVRLGERVLEDTATGTWVPPEDRNRPGFRSGVPPRSVSEETPGIGGTGTR